MFRKSITMKTLGILAITLSVGFLSMGLLSIWLQSESTMGLELENVRGTASVIVGEIDELMMKGDSKETRKYIDRVAKNPFLKGLKIYGAEGKESEKGAGELVNHQVLEAVKSGKITEVNNTENGNHTLSIAVPMANEERCKGCHDVGPKHLGAILITASTQEGYDSARRMAFTLLGVGSVFFFLMLGTIYLFFKHAIIRHIQKFEETVDELVTEMTNGRGDLTKTIAVTSQDEIGNLAVVYNKLISVINGIISRIAENAEGLRNYINTILGYIVMSHHGSSGERYRRVSRAFFSFLHSLMPFSYTASNSFTSGRVPFQEKVEARFNAVVTLSRRYPFHDFSSPAQYRSMLLYLL